MTCLNSTFCSAVRCGALQYVHYTSLAQTFGAFWRYACVSYCFHERSDITAFPRCWAANVTLGLQDIEVQVIHITRRSLTCTTQTQIIQERGYKRWAVCQQHQYFCLWGKKSISWIIKWILEKPSVNHLHLQLHLYRTIKDVRCLIHCGTLGTIDWSSSTEKHIEEV